MKTLFLLISLSVVTPALAASSPVEIPSGTADRKSTYLHLPSKYSVAKKWPLIVMLHGYKASGSIQDFYFGMSKRVSQEGFMLAIPDGKVDTDGNQFWNATDFCCDFGQTKVDDVGFLLGLVAQLQRDYSVDPDRIYLLGHSNGGFMSNRLLCEASHVFAGVVSLAGVNYKDMSVCKPSTPVSYLQIHGIGDETIRYEGTDKYPGAIETAEFWAKNNDCEKTPIARGRANLTHSIFGDDTSMQSWLGCKNATQVGLWTIQKSDSRLHNAHIPWLSGEFTDRVLGFLLSQKRGR